jgi:glycosyltransferase involved in cell wall biosynthesis
MKISVVILAKNEEKHLNDCLMQFNDFADEIVYGDMESIDNSVNIAKKYTDKIYHYKQTNYLDSTKTKLCDQATGDWILIIDADERLTKKLKDQLAFIASNDLADIVDIPFQIYILEKKIIGLGWQYDSHERFFKKDYLKYSDFHHSKPLMKGRILKLKRSEHINIKHYWVNDWQTLIRKIVYYSQGQAEKLDHEGVKFSNILMVWKVLRQFLSRYIRSYGFLNGWLGLKVAMIMCFDIFLTYIKLEDIQKGKNE